MQVNQMIITSDIDIESQENQKEIEKKENIPSVIPKKIGGVSTVPIDEVNKIAENAQLEIQIDIKSEIQKEQESLQNPILYKCKRCGKQVENLFQMDICKSCLTMDFQRLIHLINSIRK